MACINLLGIELKEIFDMSKKQPSDIYSNGKIANGGEETLQEQDQYVYENVYLQRGRRASLGTLVVTQQKIVFRGQQELWVYHSLVYSIAKCTHIHFDVCIDVYCRNFLYLRILASNAEELHAILLKYSHGTVPRYINLENNFYVHDALVEFNRQIMRTPHEEKLRAFWRLCTANADYTLVPTYPAQLFVPACISDAVLRPAARFRAGNRFPALCYVHATGACMLRSAQPCVGIKSARSIQDERLVQSVFELGVPDVGTGLIVDARPFANALANTARGGGTEAAEYYACRKVFVSIDNIHVVRDSLQGVIDILAAHATNGASISAVALGRTNWLHYIHVILEGTVLILESLQSAEHVLVHCSDGWDRTGIMVSVVQICSDPYFRTIKGFQVLVEKEWLSFGHKFATRCAHSCDVNDTEGFLNKVQNFYMQARREVSPVFQQFLDAVYQIWCVFPHEFEFTEFYLTDIFLHAYSCQFGNFLYNCEYDRVLHNTAHNTRSLWSFLDAHAGSDRYANTYSPTETVLWPRFTTLKYWSALFNCPQLDTFTHRVVVSPGAAVFKESQNTDPSLEYYQPAALGSTVVDKIRTLWSKFSLSEQ